MPPKKEKQIVFALNSGEEWAEVVNEENRKLVVIDVHLNWCGPCTVMNTNYRTLFY
jgi:thioredoxin 1